MRRLGLFPLIAAALLLAACGGGGGSSQGELPAGFVTAAREAAQSALLTLEDFPEGWTARVRPEVDLQLSPDCESLSRDELPGAIATAASEQFIGPSEQPLTPGDSVTSDVAVFGSEDAAEAALTEQESTMERCRDEFLTEMERVVREAIQEEGIQPDQIGEISIALREVDFPEVGDSLRNSRLEIRGTVAGFNFTSTVDIVAIRQDRLVGALSYTAVGGADIQEVQQIAEILADKLAKADDSLPD